MKRAILDALKAITQRPAGTFDYNGKTVQQVFQAAMHGHTSTDEALVWMQDQLLSAPNGTEVNVMPSTSSLPAGSSPRARSCALATATSRSLVCASAVETAAFTLIRDTFFALYRYNLSYLFRTTGTGRLIRTEPSIDTVM